ncbi:hypothetical protein F5B18DRAFT_631701 [Nemania serpens]|nr:hypothetical protein F5B18DRAFT_631701 [Nemania serpens]
MRFGLSRLVSQKGSILSRKPSRFNIATRDINGIFRARNASGYHPVSPFFSVRTGTLIEGFPTTRRQFYGLSRDNKARIIAELEDLHYNPALGTPDQTQERLSMLTGIQAPLADAASNVDLST